MMVPLWYVILLGIGFILYPILILICIKLYPPPKFSILTRTISGLGSPEHKSYKIFNPTICVMGILIAPLPYFLLQALPLMWMTYIGIGSFFAVPVGMMLVGIFHADRETGHMAGAILSFGGALIANIFLFYPVLQSPLNIVVSISQIAIWIISVPLFYAFVKHMPSYVPDEPIEKLLYNINLWEWSAFFSLQAWILAIFINLIVL